MSAHVIVNVDVHDTEPMKTASNSPDRRSVLSGANTSSAVVRPRCWKAIGSPSASSSSSFRMWPGPRNGGLRASTLPARLSVKRSRRRR